MEQVVNIWDKIYKDGNQICHYPFTDLVSLVLRFNKYYPPKAKVLECGFGTGPNIQFFLDQNFEYHGIEGSETALDYTRKHFPDGKYTIMDLRKPLPYEDNFFDLVVDRCVFTLNPYEEIEKMLGEVYRVLKPGRLFIGVDWFCKNHSHVEKIKEETACDRFRHGFFFNDDNIMELFKDVNILHLGRKKYTVLFPRQFTDSYYDIVAQKPKL